MRDNRHNRIHRTNQRNRAHGASGDSAGSGAPAATVLPLTDGRVRDARTAGGKAAALARAAAAGLPVLPGFVVLPAAGRAHEPGLRRAWREMSADGRVPLAVRSSSAAEDTARSSMAGQFASVLGVRGWEEFTAAVQTVRDSAAARGSRAAMAVLVQPMVRSRAGGVLFGADPVTGRTDRLLLSVVRGGPDRLVSGERQGTTLPLTRHGRRPHDAPPGADGGPLTPAELRRLAALARRARRVFGGPQDMEFGFEADTGRLWLFQSRPITAMAPRPRRRARLLGPGPVAETMPGVLQPLEEDLWVTPMAHGLAAALHLAGAAPRRVLRARPVVTTVAGRAVADLALLGAATPSSRARRVLAALNPLPGARRLGAAWRVGRLRGTLPRLAEALLTDVDRRLAEAGPPAGLSAAQLAAALRWARAVLVPLHAQEALAGALLPAAAHGPGSGTAAASGLAALRHGRAEGLPDERLVRARPEVLALVPPSLTEPLRLPARGTAGTGPGTPGTPGTGRLGPREALRLRIRWVQEFQARLVAELAGRLGVTSGTAARLRWEELMAAAHGAALPPDLAARPARAASAPLPDAFRLAEGGVVVADAAPRPAGARGGAAGVSGGRVTGTAWDGAGEPPERPVLVVRTLDPALAPLLPSLTGLVAQTGSPLSHLAVLARELGLAAVTGAAGAVDRFPPGTPLVVDGASGEVARAGEDAPGGGRELAGAEVRR
ncbi:PEP/pyruvate-binding domain-containing protein [Streptomyces sp. 7-21]|uniref:PEP/pyruvate-binding domain-containing protein n=1 Tax=Streptomyces sp. 7-21 TaxID=2802283 RepID=UPI0027DE572C|nr:PEP/pyruvate-binding domain-containing protein [Streptomyces sp. 7-21]